MDTLTLGATKGLVPPSFPDPHLLTLEDFDRMLNYCLDNKVDDLIMMSGNPWAVMWSSRVVRLGRRGLTTSELSRLLNELVGSENAYINVSSKANPADFSYILKVGRGVRVRFRVSCTACLGADGQAGLHFVVRPSGSIASTMDALGVPKLIQDACMPEAGIVLVTGPTGSGKTTLLDSMMRAQATRPDGQHILTFYEPIENDLNTIPGITGIISQCEVGDTGFRSDVKSFPLAVRNALRRHPNVVLVGESRDAETIEGAVTLAMTGHATYTTAHTSSTHGAISRMANQFQDRVRITYSLIDNVRLIVHQRLVATPSGVGRSPIMSALVFNQDVRSTLARLENIDKIPAAINEMTKDKSIGINLLDDAIQKHSDGKIHDDALHVIRREVELEKL
jgi:Tfp pilus assembly pilus retraction ATPase PilT